MNLKICLMLPALAVSSACADTLPQRFAQGDPKNGSVTLYWLNGALTEETVREQLARLQRDGFTGIAPLPMKGKTKPDYLTDDYFRLYRFMLDELAARGMEAIFYDDCNFPTGTAGGRFKTLYPDRRIKYLVRVEQTAGGGKQAVPVPRGKLMSACVSHPGGGGLRAVTKAVRIEPAAAGGTAHLELPEGEWRLQLFFCCVAENREMVDYLDPDAVGKLLGLTYEEYFKRFPEHFGRTIRTTFYDDHAYYYVPNAATWTDAFNEKFTARHGFEPDALYPSLFENTGGRDAANRAYLFGFRDELMARGYPRVVSEWAAKHGIACSGHPAGTYRPNPLQLMGDGLLYFKYQDVPLCDYIHSLRHGADGFAIPASAAYNYDKDTLICEIYGNFQPDALDDSNMLYRAGMDVYARGVNRLLPHGTWYDAGKVDIIPEISWRNPKMAPELGNYNRWVSRCEMILQNSRHSAQVGILYPIADLRARYCFTDYKVTNGREPVRGNDYYAFLGLMTKKLRTDFTLIHPEVLDERCAVKPGGVLRLDNPRNFEEYSMLIVPYSRTIHASNLAKIKEYADTGGTVLFLGGYPANAAEFSQDEAVAALVEELKRNPRTHVIAEPGAGNTAAFLHAQLDPVVRVGDVRIVRRAARGDLPGAFYDTDYAYNPLHKVKEGMDFFFFGNPTDHALSAEIALKPIAGRSIEIWDPHTGGIEACPHELRSGKIHLTLPLEPVSSRFIVLR